MTRKKCRVQFSSRNMDTVCIRLCVFFLLQISTLPILNIEEDATINDDEECASKQIVRHVAVALKRYMEAHLHLKAEQLQRAEKVRTERTDAAWQPSIPPYKVRTFSSHCFSRTYYIS